MLTLLGGLAEFERELIRARTGEGRARAKARGVHVGRPPKLTPRQRQEALKRREAGESLSDIYLRYGAYDDSEAVSLTNKRRAALGFAGLMGGNFSVNFCR
jgi:DNA invertase Pin-like site-specific DNA recombinase